MKVNFKELPKENFLYWLIRLFTRNPRDTNIYATINGDSLIIKRGVWVEIAKSYLRLLDKNKYPCQVMPSIDNPFGKRP